VLGFYQLIIPEKAMLSQQDFFLFSSYFIFQKVDVGSVRVLADFFDFLGADVC
jgi:hypothetical protein